MWLKLVKKAESIHSYYSGYSICTFKQLRNRIATWNDSYHVLPWRSVNIPEQASSKNVSHVVTELYFFLSIFLPKRSVNQKSTHDTPILMIYIPMSLTQLSFFSALWLSPSFFFQWITRKWFRVLFLKNFFLFSEMTDRKWTFDHFAYVSSPTLNPEEMTTDVRFFISLQKVLNWKTTFRRLHYLHILIGFEKSTALTGSHQNQLLKTKRRFEIFSFCSWQTPRYFQIIRVHLTMFAANFLRCDMSNFRYCER